jgi:nucleoside-diphosphate-sugar epimerase
MLNILVTGGNGFLGQHLINELSKIDCKIKVICRKKHEKYYYDIHSYGNVEVIYEVDITNYKQIEPFFKGIDVVCHLAGKVSFKRKDKQEQFNINVKGTQNVLDASKRYGVKKFIHVSSTASLGHSQTTITEKHVFNWEGLAKKAHYSYSKHLAEKIILSEKNSENGLEVIIINPALILGPGDYSISPKLISSIKKQEVPFNPPGSNSIVDVRDVARAIVFFLSKEGCFEKYILCSDSFSYKELNNFISDVLEMPKTKRVMPYFSYPFLLTGAWLYELFSREPKVTAENVYFSFKDRRHSSQKIKELGFSFNYAPKQTISDTVTFLKKEKLI